MSQRQYRVGVSGIGGFLSLIFLSTAVLGQSASSNPQLDQFVQEQRALGQERQQLIAQDATPEQMEAWQEQNAARFAAQRQRRQALAAAAALQPLAQVPSPRLPENASPALRDFLTNQAQLANARVQIHNQLLQGLPPHPTAQQMAQLRQNEIAQFQQQHAGELQLQAARARALAQENASKPISEPPALRIPEGASPQLVAYLTARDQLMRDRLTVMNQNASATPQVRAVALQAWENRNQVRKQQIQRAAQALAAAQNSN